MVQAFIFDLHGGRSMVRYFQPLMSYLEEQNRGRQETTKRATEGSHETTPFL